MRQFGDELDLLGGKASLKPRIDLVSAQTFSHSLFVMSYAPLRKLVAFTAAVKFESKLTACSHRLALFSTVARSYEHFIVDCGLWIRMDPMAPRRLRTSHDKTAPFQDAVIIENRVK